MGEPEADRPSGAGETADRAARAVADGRLVSLETWTLATFDLALFVLVPVTAGHFDGALSDLLQGLDTLVGVVIFCFLWVLFVLATRWVQSQVSLTDPLGTLALHGFAAGAVAGIVFLSGLAAALALSGLADGMSLATVNLRAVAGLLPLFLISIGIAAVVGGVIGLLVGFVDVVCYRLAGRVLDATRPAR
ncbi:MAG: hypothetical protein ABEH86_13815 [Haloarcula sp.]